MDRGVIVGDIRGIATVNGIKPDLFEAICTVESSLNPFAIRFEPAYKYFYFVRENASRLNITVETETMLQASSYGLCQMMGAGIRELGFAGNLTECFGDYKIVLKFGALHLKKLLVRYNDEADVISAYNAGTAIKTMGGMYQNQQYVDKVHAALTKLRAMP